MACTGSSSWAADIASGWSVPGNTDSHLVNEDDDGDDNDKVRYECS